jgi:nitrogen fixation protein NifU and related proteins
MSDAMEQLYQQVILDHARARHGSGLVDAPGGDDDHVGSSHQVNTTCGDEITVEVVVGGDQVVRDVRWQGQGCSISQASASMLHDLVVGADLGTTDRITTALRDLLGSRGAGLDDETEDLLGDASAFTGVGRFPARVKCAMLAWSALTDALVVSGAREGAQR